MHDAGQLAARVLSVASRAARPGVSAADIDVLISREIESAGAVALFRGLQEGEGPCFPASSCISINDEVIHGIPGARRIEHGDLVTIDVGLSLRGWCADAAVSLVAVAHGQEDSALISRRRALRAATHDVLHGGIERAQPGASWLSIAQWMEHRAAEMGYAIVSDFVGHGIGRALHEPPKAPAYRAGYTGPDYVLEPGMVLAIEPILAEREPSPEPQRRPGVLARHGAMRCRVRTREDGWTVTTCAGVDACHIEHTVAITERGPWALTDVAGSGPGVGPRSA